MPFIRKTETKQAQMVTDARNLFIGRSDEIQFFVDHILRFEEPSHNIVSLYGQGGVGKTTLLRRFIEEAHAISMKNNCLTARVDEQQSSLTSMMEKFAEHLGIKGEFDKTAAQYKESLRKLRTERELAHDTIGRKATTAITHSLSKGVPIVGDLLEQGTSFAVDFMWDEIQYRQRMKDEKYLENPIRDLTKAFVKELNERAKNHHCLILCFDTFERLAQDVAPWLLDYFLPADLNGNIVLVVAGRDPIERSLPDDPKRWLSYIDQGVVHQIELKSFTEEETRKYLMERGISDDERIVQIWQLSRGLPLYLGLLTANPQGQIDPTADVVKNFLRWIPEQEQTKRKVVLDIALLSRPFNRDELKAFSYISDEERPELYNWLLMQPFVRRNMEDGRCSYHEVAQELFSRHLYTLSSDEYYTIRYTLVEYYRGVLTHIEKAEGKEVYKSQQWLEVRLALAYQFLLLPDEASHIKTIEEILYALRHGKRKEIVSFLREISKQQLKMKISSSAWRTADALLQCVEFDDSRPELQAEIDYLLVKARSLPTFSKEMLAVIYTTKGRISHALKDYQQAIVDYCQAISLDPHNATYYNYRGYAYFALEDYQRALADYNRSISLKPHNAKYYNNRSYVCYCFKDFQNALVDMDQAISLDPHNATYYNNRGYICYSLKDYQHACSNYQQAISLDPHNATYYNYRGTAHFALRDYQNAITDYQQAISLDPHNATYYNNRGYAYYYLKDFQRALADYDQATSLDPHNATYYNYRGTAYFALENYQHALADYNQAISLNPKEATTYNNRGAAYYLLKDYQRALADYDQAEVLDPSSTAYYDDNSIISYAPKDYQYAFGDDNQTITLDSSMADYYHYRGNAYFALQDYQRALADYNQAITLDLNNANYYYDRGDAYVSIKQYEQAIDDYNHALQLEPASSQAYFSRGVTYLWLKYSKQAMADFLQSWMLDATDPNIGWMTEWSRMCQEKADEEVTERLDMIAASNPEHYAAFICRGVAYWIRKQFHEALVELEEVISMYLDKWGAYFWQGMVYASLGQDEEARNAVEMAISKNLPPVLLSSLRWLEQDRPEFYAEYVVPLLARFDV